MYFPKTILIIFIIILPLFISCGIGSDSNPITTSMVDTPAFENIPILSNVLTPDSISRVSPETTYIFADAHNTHDFGRIDTVYFIVTRPDSTSNGIAFLLHDDGLHGDSLMGDGRFTLGIQLQSPTPPPPGRYEFTFTAKNSLGFYAEPVMKVIIIY